MSDYDVKLIGGLTGKIWWPVGAQCGFPIRIDLKEEAQRFSEKPTLRELVLHLFRERGGDFQSTELTADTVIVVSRCEVRQEGSKRVTTHVCREWPITAFKSIKDCVNSEVYSTDFCDD